jgi:hypothetical protein
MAILGFPRGVIWAHYRTGGRQAKTLDELAGKLLFAGNLFHQMCFKG